MRLETDRVALANVTLDQLCKELALLNAEDNVRAILSQSDEVYLQTAIFANGFVIEKREGSEDAHFHAVPGHAPLPRLKPMPPRNWLQRILGPDDFPLSECAFTHAEMHRVFVAYLQGQEPDPPLKWSPGPCDG